MNEKMPSTTQKNKISFLVQRAMLCNQKKMLHRKTPIPQRFRGFFVPRFSSANKKIFFFARRTWTTDPCVFRRLLRDVFSRKPPFFVSTDNFFLRSSLKSKDDLPACSGKRFALHFGANLTYLNNTVFLRHTRCILEDALPCNVFELCLLKCVIHRLIIDDLWWNIRTFVIVSTRNSKVYSGQLSRRER